MSKNKNEKIIFRSTCARSFFVYYFVGCFTLLISLFFYEYFFHAADPKLIKKFVFTAGITTLIVSIVAPVLFLRKVEVTEERVVVSWALVNKRKVIPLSIIDRFERGNFLASPAVKVHFKSGRIEKIPFVDRSEEMVNYLTPDKFPCNQKKKPGQAA
jgi:hypothetical protein